MELPFRGEFFDSKLERTSYVDGWFSGVHIGAQAMLEYISKELGLTSEQKEKFESEIEDVIGKIDTR